MDLLANLTALSPPGDASSAARAAAAMRSEAIMAYTRMGASSGRPRDDISADDSAIADASMDGLEPCESVSSMQCSADPTAFTGFQSRRSAPVGSVHALQQLQQPMRLALDLGSSASERGFRPEGVSVSQLSQNTSYSQQQQFTELLYGDDTQDDVSIAALDASRQDALDNEDDDDAVVANSADPSTPRPTPTFVTRGAAEPLAAAASPAAPNFLFAMDSAVRSRQAAKSSVESAVKARVSTESDDLSLTMPATTRSAPAKSIVCDADVVVIDDDEEQENARSAPVFTSDVTDELAHLEPVQWFSAEDTPEGGEEASINSSGAMHRARSDSTESFPDTQSLGDTEAEEEDKDATEDIDMGASVNAVSEEDTELQSLGDTEDVAHRDEDDEEESPTHPPSSDLSTRTMSPVPDAHGKVAPSPGRAALKKRSALATHALPALSDVDSQDQQQQQDDDAPSRLTTARAAPVAVCSCRRGAACVCSGAKAPVATKLLSASRNLAMSFALPDSQESASQTHDDDSARTTAASVSRLHEAHADSASSLASLSLPPLARASPAKRAMAPPKAPASGLKRSASSSEATTPSSVSTGTSSTESTPARRKRVRSAPSPDVGTLEALTPMRSNDATPTRRSTRISPATGYETSSSLRTPVAIASVRTRARGTPLVPPHRPVATRARTMFKYKFEFCLTGFSSGSEALVVAMIEEHGGKIVDEHALHGHNSKAVVITTAGSWRKLKFMYAVACGIPVVHPEWLRACIKAGHVAPFDGYCVPSGYSVLTRTFECLPVRPLDIFAGKSFGIPYDVADSENVKSARGLGAIIVFILKTCGAARVIEVRGSRWLA